MKPDLYFNLAAEHFGYLHESEIAKQDREVIALATFLREKFAPAIASLKDTERLDWIGAEEADVDRIDRVETYWFEGVDLRDAIDQAMKE